MSSQAHTQMLVGALATMGQYAVQRTQHQKDMAIEQLRAGTLAHMVDALVSQRVAAVEAGFRELLSGYAEQARHYMAQQRSYADRELDTSDPMRRIELRARLQDIDTQLETLRADARIIFFHMTEVVRALGAPRAGFAAEFAPSLALVIDQGAFPQ